MDPQEDAQCSCVVDNLEVASLANGKPRGASVAHYRYRTIALDWALFAALKHSTRGVHTSIHGDGCSNEQ